MLTTFIQAAMAQAQFERLADDNSVYGEIPGFQGVWAKAPSEAECRRELQEVLEDWLLIGLRLGHPIPVVDGIDLNARVAV